MNKLVFKAYFKESRIPVKQFNTALATKLVLNQDNKQVFTELAHIRDDIANFVKGGNNLLICSNNVGNGKTTWAFKIAAAFLKYASERSYTNNKAMLFINVPDYFLLRKASITDYSLQAEVRSIEQSIRIAKLVIFDDISNNMTDFETTELFSWINTRQSNNLSCIFTTNGEPKDLVRTLSAKLYDRIVNNSYVKIIKDGSHRVTDNKY